MAPPVVPVAAVVAAGAGAAATAGDVAGWPPYVTGGPAA